MTTSTPETVPVSLTSEEVELIIGTFDDTEFVDEDTEAAQSVLSKMNEALRRLPRDPEAA